MALMNSTVTRPAPTTSSNAAAKGAPAMKNTHARMALPAPSMIQAFTSFFNSMARTNSNAVDNSNAMLISDINSI